MWSKSLQSPHVATHTHTHTHTHIYIYMDINTQLWQSISYTGTQANTHVKWLVAETSEHILHSASKTVKVALTSHYSFFLLLHLPLIPSLSVVSSPFPSWWLRWNFKQELWSLSMTVTRFFFFFFFLNKKASVKHKQTLRGEISQCHPLRSRALAASLSACNCCILFDHKDDCTLCSSPETLSISLVTVTSGTQPWIIRYVSDV